MGVAAVLSDWFRNSFCSHQSEGGGGTANDLLSSLRVGCWGLGVGAGFLVVVLVLVLVVLVPPPLLLAQYVFLNNDGLGRDPPGSNVFFWLRKKELEEIPNRKIGRLQGDAQSLHPCRT